jgi:lysozyme
MMTPEMYYQLKKLLIKHEDKRNNPYLDTLEKITIGIGRNLTDRGIDDKEIEILFSNDVSYFYDKLSENYPWFLNLTINRQIALIDMAFMGFKSFQSFKRMIKALENTDFDLAAFEVLNSKYALQVGQRAEDIANILRTGEIAWDSIGARN